MLKIALLVLIGVGFVLYFVPLRIWHTWHTASSAGAPVDLGILIAMRLRRVPASTIVESYITATNEGLDLSLDQLEAQFLAGGNVDRVVNAMVIAKTANLELGFSQACAIDLVGRDLLEAVQMSIHPRVITIPESDVAPKDGVPLRVRSRVTVVADLDRFVGGAGEEELVSRLVEAMVSTIAAAEAHQDVLDNGTDREDGRRRGARCGHRVQNCLHRSGCRSRRRILEEVEDTRHFG